MPGRAGISTVPIDPHGTYPTDFRVEKLSGHVQIERFLRTGIGESVLRRATFAGENWIARFGHLLDKAPGRQFSIRCDSLVNAVRYEIPVTVERICAKAVAVETSSEQQQVTLSNDETISARLVVDSPGRSLSVSIGTSPYWTAQRWARFIAWSVQEPLRPWRRVPSGAELLGHSSSSSSSSSSSRSSSSSLSSSA
jgi:hypothetical protein